MPGALLTFETRRKGEHRWTTRAELQPGYRAGSVADSTPASQGVVLFWCEIGGSFVCRADTGVALDYGGMDRLLLTEVDGLHPLAILAAGETFDMPLVDRTAGRYTGRWTHHVGR